jgi:hypothetical protein
MLGADVHTLDHDPAIVQQDIDHLAALAFIFEAATDDFHRVAFANLYSHS